MSVEIIAEVVQNLVFFFCDNLNETIRYKISTNFNILHVVVIFSALGIGGIKDFIYLRIIILVEAEGTYKFIVLHFKVIQNI